jgi:hypothetical protein
MIHIVKQHDALIYHIHMVGTLSKKYGRNKPVIVQFLVDVVSSPLYNRKPL